MGNLRGTFLGDSEAPGLGGVGTRPLSEHGFSGLTATAGRRQALLLQGLSPRASPHAGSFGMPAAPRVQGS